MAITQGVTLIPNVLHLQAFDSFLLQPRDFLFLAGGLPLSSIPSTAFPALFGLPTGTGLQGVSLPAAALF